MPREPARRPSMSGSTPASNGVLVSAALDAAAEALRADSTIGQAAFYRVMRASLERLFPHASEARIMDALAQLRRIAQVDHPDQHWH